MLFDISHTCVFYLVSVSSHLIQLITFMIKWILSLLAHLLCSRLACSDVSKNNFKKYDWRNLQNLIMLIKKYNWTVYV